MALDTTHQQIFTAWPYLDRVDVLSTADYHLIHSIPILSPTTIDISPDGATIAVGTSASHIFFFSTTTFAKTNDIVFPDARLGISTFLYTANGNAIIRAEAGLSTGGGVTAYWDHNANAFKNEGWAGQIDPTAYSATGPLARSGDYSKIILGDATSGGEVQVVDGNTGQVLWQMGGLGFGFGGYIDALAANRDGSRYAVCVEPAGLAQSMIILDAAFDEIYQDEAGCYNMIFSGDGQKLFRDFGTSVQALDMASFTATTLPNYFTSKGSNFNGFPTQLMAADSTGMLYGTNSNQVINTTGPALWIALDTTESTAPTIPPATDPVKIVHVIDNVGSPQGGDSIRLICTGVNNGNPGSVSVTIGGAPAQGINFSNGFLSSQTTLIVKTPPGQPGLANIVLTVSGVSDTAPKAFQYAASRTIIPFSTIPNFLLYDPGRNRLYASHKDQVEVIDVASKTVLTPLVPAGGKLPSSQFAGLSLSLDGNRLYIADAGANLVHILDLANPGAGSTIDPIKIVKATTPIVVSRVFELSNGQILGSGETQPNLSPTLPTLFLIDPKNLTGDWARDAYGYPIVANLWNTTNQGQHALLDGGGQNLITGAVGLWNTNSSTNFAPSAETQFLMEAAADDDGTVIAVGGSTPGIMLSTPQFVDFNLYPLGAIYQHLIIPLPTGTPSFFLHPTGALLYKAGVVTGNGSGPLSTVQVDDVHQARSAASIAFPEPLAGSYLPTYEHMLTIDPTGTYLFGVTTSGITIMQLNSVPLSIGHVQPTFVQPGGGQTLTLRGSGFQSGASVTIGGAQASATFIDQNTLSVQAPSLASGFQDVTVTLPGGATYTAPNLLQVLGTQPTPAITGFSPAGVPVTTHFPLPTTTVTVLGSNFEIYDTVQMNGQTVPSQFLNTNQMQATIPVQFVQTTGTISVNVVSPYTGSSNVAALPMVNPVPALTGNFPPVFAVGSSPTLNLVGTGFDYNSVIQWNGQNLPTTLGGQTADGLQSLSATAPSTLTQQAGPVTITVFNPPPAGGLSNSLQGVVSSSDPTPLFTLFTPNNTSYQNFSSYPTTLDFGSHVLNIPLTYTLYIQDPDRTGYGFSAVSISPGPFTMSIPGNCPSIAPGYGCDIFLTFSPAAIGPATATLTITDNAVGSPHSITLTGTGIQTPAPVVVLNSISNVGDVTTAQILGFATLGGLNVPATAWVEYGTDKTLATYSQSPPITLSGDGPANINVSGLLGGTVYAARIAVQSAGGIARSAIHLFSTQTAAPYVVFSLPAGSSNTISVNPGQTATWNFSASSAASGYIGTANLTCTGFPAGSTCTVSPSQIAIGAASVPFTVTATTTAAQAAMRQQPVRSAVAWSLCFLLGFGVWAARRRAIRFGLVVLLLVASAGVFSSCGGGSGSTGGGGSHSTATPPGNYTLTLTWSSGGVQSTYNIYLNVL